jgi:elongation factor P
MELPPHVELAVTYSEPAVRGDTTSGSTKATFETGMEVRVPLFVKEGDRVKVTRKELDSAGR